MELEIKNQSDQITHLALRGKLDTAGVGENRVKVYQPHGPKGKTAPFGHVGSHFSFLLRLADALSPLKALDRRGAKMVLLSPQPAVREVLSLSGFDQLMPVYNDEETALAFLARSEGR
jgi:hypothetical protein